MKYALAGGLAGCWWNVVYLTPPTVMKSLKWKKFSANELWPFFKKIMYPYPVVKPVREVYDFISYAWPTTILKFMELSNKTKDQTMLHFLAAIHYMVRSLFLYKVFIVNVLRYRLIIMKNLQSYQFLYTGTFTWPSGSMDTTHVILDEVMMSFKSICDCLHIGKQIPYPMPFAMKLES